MRITRCKAAPETGERRAPITTSGSVTAKISSLLVGTQGLTKLGSGTLELNNANTYTGSVVVSAGTLSIIQDSNLGNLSNALTIQNNAALSSAGFLTLRTITIGSGGGKINVVDSGSGSLVLATGFTADANPFTAAGNGTLILNGASIAHRHQPHPERHRDSE